MAGKNKNLAGIAEKFGGRKILVIGDIMLDKYIWGDVNRISPEAPVQVVNVINEQHVPGGASNVAANIASLGAKASIVGIVGDDSTKEHLISELKKRNVDTGSLVTDESKRTILKVRIFGRKQQLLRFDYEKTGDIGKNTEKKLIDIIGKKVNDADAVIVSDYAKGTITKSLMEKLKAMCNGKNKMIVVDPKPEHKEFYSNVTLITPNHSEAHKMTRFKEDEDAKIDIEKMGREILNDLKSNVLITRGEKGMSLFEKNGRITHIPTFAKEVYDIIGAGDTAVATLTLALACGASLEDSAIIANYAAGIVVGKVGTSAVTIEELKRSIENG